MIIITLSFNIETITVVILTLKPKIPTNAEEKSYNLSGFITLTKLILPLSPRPFVPAACAETILHRGSNACW